MPHQVRSLRFTKGMEALPLRHPRSPILLDWASERGWLRTPHLFASAFFVHSYRFFPDIVDERNSGANYSSMSGSASVGRAGQAL
jgi:hypothetical protein